MHPTCCPSLHLTYICAVCAYANNQHDLSELDVEELEQTPFARAMQLSKVIMSQFMDKVYMVSGILEDGLFMRLGFA